MAYVKIYTASAESAVINVPELIGKSILLLMRQTDYEIPIAHQGVNDASICFDFDNTTGDIDLQTNTKIGEVITILWKD